jgi:hypothetical protein
MPSSRSLSNRRSARTEPGFLAQLHGGGDLCRNQPRHLAMNPSRTLRSACLLRPSEFHSGAPAPECAPLPSEPLFNPP